MLYVVYDACYDTIVLRCNVLIYTKQCCDMYLVILWYIYCVLIRCILHNNLHNVMLHETLIQLFNS